VLHECFNLVNIKKIRPRLDKRLLLASKKLLAHFPIFSMAQQHFWFKSYKCKRSMLQVNAKCQESMELW